MKEVEKLNRTLNEIAKKNSKVTMVRGNVKSVDWGNKTAVVTSLVDGLDYFDVSLGLGCFQQKPKKGTACVIGLIDGTLGGLLISADEVEELVIKEAGFVLKKDGEDLRTVLNDMIDEISKIFVVYGVSINVGAMTAIKQRLNIILSQ